MSLTLKVSRKTQTDFTLKVKIENFQQKIELLITFTQRKHKSQAIIFPKKIISMFMS